MNIGYQPKGGMCASCKYIKNDCSNLPFSTYPKIGSYKESISRQGLTIILVKCLEYSNKWEQ